MLLKRDVYGLKIKRFWFFTNLYSVIGLIQIKNTSVIQQISYTPHLLYLDKMFNIFIDCFQEKTSTSVEEISKGHGNPKDSVEYFFKNSLAYICLI